MGEVVVVNVVLVPILARLEPQKRGWFLAAIFPRVGLGVLLLIVLLMMFAARGL